ncbi:MAG: hypothetical protein QM451_00655 [Bacillota bacterium]|nr:hypothetical protein [Bacillota bacterium]HHT91616.1 hypothetical protein [Bacillota bacterium]
MSEVGASTTQWDFLVGYPLDQAKQVLQEEAVPYRLQFTAAPGKGSSEEETSEGDAFIIAVRALEPLVLICAYPDWNVS